MAKKIKAEEIIEKISKLYRDERNKEGVLFKELQDISFTLEQHKDDGYKNITVVEYENLKKLQRILEQNKKLQEKYCDGISTVRELLMDLGFDTVIDIKGGEI